jgi:hypothetical protein
VDALPALRGAAREANQFTSLLLAFLEVICDHDDASLSKAVVLGLSELHVVLQKLRLLLAYCGRKGVRLWVLMNTEAAASELLVVMGSVATAVDVLSGPWTRHLESSAARPHGRESLIHARDCRRCRLHQLRRAGAGPRLP